MRSGVVAIVGRPNVGKSTLVNAMVGEKVSIVSNKVQTTRRQVRGILTTDDAQVVFVDTPGVIKPRTLLGERSNASAYSATDGVDFSLFVLDATAPLGAGDMLIASRLPKDTFVVVNKSDRARRDQMLEQLKMAGELEFRDYFPVSARTGEGVDELVEAIIERLPEGPMLYPEEEVTDQDEHRWVAELVREQLLAVTSKEVPHSVATRVTEWEWPRIRVEILVERDSQKGIVVGKGGSVLKEVGIKVREQLPPEVFLDLFVKVDKNWQQRSDSLDRLGFVTE